MLTAGEAVIEGEVEVYVLARLRRTYRYDGRDAAKVDFRTEVLGLSQVISVPLADVRLTVTVK